MVGGPGPTPRLDLGEVGRQTVGQSNPQPAAASEAPPVAAPSGPATVTPQAQAPDHGGSLPLAGPFGADPGPPVWRQPGVFRLVPLAVVIAVVIGFLTYLVLSL